MKNSVLAFITAMCFFGNAFGQTASQVSNSTVTAIYQHITWVDYFKFKVSNQTAECDEWFIVQSSDATILNRMLSILLTAKSTGTKVDFWKQSTCGTGGQLVSWIRMQ